MTKVTDWPIRPCIARPRTPTVSSGSGPNQGSAASTDGHSRITSMTPEGRTPFPATPSMPWRFPGMACYGSGPPKGSACTIPSRIFFPLSNAPNSPSPKVSTAWPGTNWAISGRFPGKECTCSTGIPASTSFFPRKGHMPRPVSRLPNPDASGFSGQTVTSTCSTVRKARFTPTRSLRKRKGSSAS